MTREWDARSYDSLPLPHEAWGARVLSRLELRGDEHVLDAGAGTGRDARRLLDLLPDGRVLAVDASQRMLDVLSSKVRDPRLEVRRHDLTQPLDVAAPLDACISVATFHWIADHDALFAHLAAALRPGGRFVAECGGRGNLTRVNAAIADVLGHGPSDDHADHGSDDGLAWRFAGAEETRDRLARAGFEDVEVALRPDPAVLEAGEQYERFLATVILGGHLERLDPAEREPFVRAVVARVGEPVVDYVRLEWTARRA